MKSKMKEAESRPSDALEAPLAGKLSKSPRLSLADSPSKSKSTTPQSHHADPPLIALLNQVYLFFWHSYSPVMYALYKINIPRILRLPPAKASQDLKLSPLRPILTLKTGKYPDRMCCVQLGLNLYFLGGEFNITNPYIDEDVIKELKNVKRDVFPPDVYFLDLAKQKNTSLKLSFCKPMNSGKASPQAFVADGKIYVIGSTIQTNIIDKSKLKDLDLESFAYFEVYDPKVDMWNILPNPPIRDMKSKWVGHAVVKKTALLTAWQRGKKCVYFFDLDRHEWKKYASLPSYPENFSGRIEYVEDTVYGCYGNTIAAIAPLAAETEDEKKKEIEEVPSLLSTIAAIAPLAAEKEDEKKKEIEEVPSLLKHYGLHLVSEEMGMDAIFNVPPQLQSSSSLLHLGNRYFCYVKTGMPPQINGIDHAIEDDKRRFISIVIFQALGKTYKEDATRLFSAKFLHSMHFVVDNPFPSEGFIDGFFSSDSVSPVLILDESLVQKQPTNLGGFQSLEELSILGTLLTCLPETIGSLRHLVRLNVSNNELKSLPESIGSLRNLLFLIVSNNKLKSLPKSIGSLRNLVRLNVSINELKSLPESIGSLRNLLRLVVSNNKLKSLPESIGSCFSLEELQANDNLIEDLPASICNLIHLESLCLDNNYMNQIPQNLLKDCKVLQNIFLHGNPISMDQFQQMEGFQDFEARSKKFDKQINSNVIDWVKRPR